MHHWCGGIRSIEHAFQAGRILRCMFLRFLFPSPWQKNNTLQHSRMDILFGLWVCEYKNLFINEKVFVFKIMHEGCFLGSSLTQSVCSCIFTTELDYEVAGCVNMRIIEVSTWQEASDSGEDIRIDNAVGRKMRYTAVTLVLCCIFTRRQYLATSNQQ